MAEHEVVVVERSELHGVLQETGSGGEPGAGQVGGPWVVERQARPYALVVETEVVGHHEELVGGGELDVAPGVREELGQLGLFGLHPDHLGREVPEELLGPVERGRLPARHDLREFEELGHRLSLGDPFGAEGDVDGLAEFGDRRFHEGGGTGIHGRTQDEQLSVPK